MNCSRVKIKIYTLLMLAVFAFLVYFTSCGGRKQAAQSPSPTPSRSRTVSPTPSPGVSEGPSQPIQFGKNTLQAGIGKKKAWVLNSKAVRYDEKNQRAVADEVKVEFYNPAGKKVLTLTARGASIDIKDKTLHFKGSVQARSNTGDEIFIKELMWDGKKKKLIGEKYVRIVRKFAVMTAKHMVADPELKQVQLSGDVKIVYPDMDKFLKF